MQIIRKQQNLSEYADSQIIISRTYALGDVVMSTAIIESAIQQGLNVSLHTTSKLKDIFMLTPYGVSYDTDMGAGDIFVDIDDPFEQYEQGIRLNQGISRNRIEMMCDYIGIIPKVLSPKIYLNDSEVQSVLMSLSKYPRPFIGIAPSSLRKEKTMPLDKWQEIISLLMPYGTVFIFDSPKNRMVLPKDVIQLSDKILRTQTIICACMDLMLTHDSFWCHVSAGVYTPQLMFPSCTDGMLIGKGYPAYHTVTNEDFPCYPCWYELQRGGCMLYEYPKCLTSLDNDAVVDAVWGLLEG